MNLIRYNSAPDSYRDYVPATFSSLIDRFFNDAMTRSGGSQFTPRVDIVESDKAYEIHVAVPGMNKDDFQLEVKDNFLTVSGERKFEAEKKEGNWRSIETQFGSFERSFSLPENVDSSKINAKYNNGILEVTLPKDEKKALKTTIKVS
jgi:HSP20 family protein